MNTLEIQRALYRLGFDPGLVDGVDGPKTQVALSSFLNAGPLARLDAEPEDAVSAALEALPAWMPSPNFNVGPATHREIRLIVIHTAETAELHDEARNIAGWLDLKQSHVSAHYVVDDDRPVQCVLERDLAWHAGTNFNGFDANQVSIGIEHAGTALQTRAQWDDDYSRKVLESSARLVAALCNRFNVPIVRPSADELRGGAAGIVGHADVNAAWTAGRGHVDPGASFPWAPYLARIQEIVTQVDEAA